MKRTILIGAMVLGFVFVANIVFGNFYVIPTRPRIAGTEITSLPYTIPSPGFYFITRDLTSTGNGITVNADNVTIDLMGFSLIGPGKSSGTGDGILMIARDNVEVRNGTVRDFGVHGIYEEEYTGKNHRIIGVRANGNGAYGIRLYGFGHLVKECLASGNTFEGIYVCAYSRVIDNIAYINHDGIHTDIGCTVTGNTANENLQTGIKVTHGCTVIGNTVYNNESFGIFAGNGCTLKGNTAYINDSNGIDTGLGCTLKGNTAYGNGSHGIYLGGDCLAHSNTVTNNSISNITCGGTCNLVDNYAP